MSLGIRGCERVQQIGPREQHAGNDKPTTAIRLLEPMAGHQENVTLLPLPPDGYAVYTRLTSPGFKEIAAMSGADSGVA